MKNCVVCNKEFKPKYVVQKYCSEECTLIIKRKKEKEYYLLHPGLKAKRCKEYYKKNKKKLLEKSKEYRSKPEIKLMRYLTGKKYREKNLDRIRKMKKEWREKYKEKNLEEVRAKAYLGSKGIKRKDNVSLYEKGLSFYKEYYKELSNLNEFGKEKKCIICEKPFTVDKSLYQMWCSDYCRYKYRYKEKYIRKLPEGKFYKDLSFVPKPKETKESYYCYKNNALKIRWVPIISKCIICKSDFNKKNARHVCCSKKCAKKKFDTENKEYVKQRRIEWANKNKEHLFNYSKERRAKIGDILNAKHREWVSKNREYNKQRAKDWREKEKDGKYLDYKIKRKQRNKQKQKMEVLNGSAN